MDDEDAVVAAVELIGRTGARGFQFGYLHEDVPTEEAAWYAHAQYRGARIIEENHPGPVEAIEALAKRILEGGICQHCNGLIGLSMAGVMIYPGTRMLDGTVMTPERARTMKQCHWTRQGKQWVRGCESGRPSGPPRRERRAAMRKQGRRR